MSKKRRTEREHDGTGEGQSEEPATEVGSLCVEMCKAQRGEASILY